MVLLPSIFQNFPQNYIDFTVNYVNSSEEQPSVSGQTVKQRREAGEENLIIRYDKIVTKAVTTHARWADVVNGL